MVFRSLLFVGNDRRRTDRSRIRRRCLVRLEFLEDRITPTSVTGLSPNLGPVAGGTMVTISGTGFTGVTAVDFGSSPATNVTVVNATSITADSPPGSIGPVDVTVAAAGGTSATSLADLFTYAAVPAVSSLSQASGPAAGGTLLTITGSGFVGATAVDFGAVPATNLTVVNDTSLTVDTPAGTGIVDVTVTTPGGTSATVPADQFTYAPSVSGLSPPAGPTTGGNLITITGHGFAGATAVDFGTTPGTNLTVVSDTTITVDSPGGTGIVDVTVHSPSGTSATSPADQFTYLATPTVTGLNPATGSLSGGTLLTITGTGFTDATAVDFGTTPATNLTVVSANAITVDSPAGNGMVGVTVTTPGGTSGNATQFTYVAAPTVSSVSPAGGPISGGTKVTITGAGFNGATVVDFGTMPATIVTVSSTSILVVSPAGTGEVDVTVMTPGGTSAKSSADQFTYAPTVSNISPTTGPPGGGTLVTITGTGLAGAMAVDFGTTAGTIVTLSSTTITAYSPPGTGYAYVTVMTPSGTSADNPSAIFTYVGAPSISGLSPATGSVAGGTLVTITGTNFLGATALNFGSTPAFYFTVLNNTTITAASPTSFATTNPQGGGTVIVSVTTPGGSSLATSWPVQFTYAPAVTGISPAAGPVSGGTLVTITGIGFTGATAVDFGTTAGTIVSINANTITVTSPPGGAGGVNVTVTTTPAAISATSPVDVFTYVGAPSITGISPNTGPFAGGSMVIITGNNLAGATAVRFGSAALGSIISDSNNQIDVSSPMGASAGTVGVTVITAGGASSAAQYTYDAAIAPMISSVTPNVGSPAGGTMVMITGTGFDLTAPTTVLFGTTPATDFTVESSTTIMAESPSGTGAVAVTVIISGVVSPPTAGDVFTFMDGPQVTNVARYGYHRQPTSLVIDFNSALDPASAQDIANYRIVGPGKQRIKVKAAVYNPAADSVTLLVGQRLVLRKSYMLTIIGSPSSGVKNPEGLFLDGTGSGLPGSNYVSWITGRDLAGVASQRTFATVLDARAKASLEFRKRAGYYSSWAAWSRLQ